MITSSRRSWYTLTPELSTKQPLSYPKLTPELSQRLVILWVLILGSSGVILGVAQGLYHQREAVTYNGNTFTALVVQFLIYLQNNP